MYRRIDDFLKDWGYESESTLKVFRNLTDESLSQRVPPDGRSLGMLAWHITQSAREMLKSGGIKISEVGVESSQPPATVAEIVAAYEAGVNEVTNTVKEQWADDQLDDEVNMYGQMWKKGIVLSAMLFHQAHHRAQMTVLMRIAGLLVPGVYGPAREEWVAYGMSAPN